MYYNYDIQNQLQRIMKNQSVFIENIETLNYDHLSDLHDGEIYKKFLKTTDGNLIKMKQAFTFTINTDGVSICEKSKLDIWPVFLTINEIKPEYRYCIDNVIVAGNFLIQHFADNFLNENYF